MGTGWFPGVVPDGKEIAFVSGRDGDREIYVMDADGRNITQLTFTPTMVVSRPGTPGGS